MLDFEYLHQVYSEMYETVSNYQEVLEDRESYSDEERDKLKSELIKLLMIRNTEVISTITDLHKMNKIMSRVSELVKFNFTDTLCEVVEELDEFIQYEEDLESDDQE